MFRAVTMLRLRALVLERDSRAVLRELGRLGMVQLAPASADMASFLPRDRSQELGRCDALLGRVHELRRSLELPHTDEPGPQPASLDQAEEDLLALEEQVKLLLGRRQAAVERLHEASVVGEQVSSYRGVALPLEPDCSFLHLVTGTLPPGNLDALRVEVGQKVVLLPLAERNGRQTLVAMSTHCGWPALESLLQRAAFQPDVLPVAPGATSDTFSEQNGLEQRQLDAELAQLEAELRALAGGCAPALAAAEKLVSTERALLEAEQSSVRSDATVLLEGWVPADDAAALERRLRETTRGRCVIETARAESPAGQVPVLLRHSRLVRPFEMLVAAFGLPSYGELEPTLLVALSYVVMFGMMFGDAGHGALLAGAGLIAMRRARSPRMRDVGVLLLLGGLSSTIFGLVYGSYFGLEQLKHHALWRDPLAGDPLRLMVVAIGIGVVLISTGLVLNVVNCIRRGDWIGAVLGKFGLVGLLFYWGALALVTGLAPARSPCLLILFFVVPLVGWCLKEPVELVLSRRRGHPAEGVLAAITESFVGAFEAVLSYLANTISFVRLAAYAMSHAALLTATFLMADELKHGSGGVVLSGIVVVLGNLVAFLLEGTVAAVQALRLEYYEFFGKFYSGEGRPFAPFRLATSEPGSPEVT